MSKSQPALRRACTARQDASARPSSLLSMTSTTKPKFKPSAGQQLFWKDFLMVYTVPVTLYQWPCTNVNKTDCYPHGAYHLQNPERIFMKDCLKDTRCLRPSNYSQIFSLPACGCWDALPSRLGRGCAYAVEPQRPSGCGCAGQHDSTEGAGRPQEHGGDPAPSVTGPDTGPLRRNFLLILVSGTVPLLKQSLLGFKR